MKTPGEHVVQYDGYPDIRDPGEAERRCTAQPKKETMRRSDQDIFETFTSTRRSKAQQHHQKLDKSATASA